MEGALTEYLRGTEWKGLAFSEGSLMFTLYSLILQSLPMGLAVRASEFVDSVEHFCYKDKRIYAEATGQGQVVGTWTLNGFAVPGTLQIPEGMLKPGRNDVCIGRSQSFDGLRLYSSNAILMRADKTEEGFEYLFSSAVDLEMVFENFSGKLDITTADGQDVKYSIVEIIGTNKVNIKCEGNADLIVQLHNI